MEIDTNKGWFKFYREILESHVWLKSKPEYKTVLVTLMGMVNHKEKEWEFKGKTFKCKPGQVVTSLDSILKKCGKGISIQNVRTALSRFENLGFLTNQSSNEGRLITLCGLEKYEKPDKKQKAVTNKRPTTTSHFTHNRFTSNKNVEENIMKEISQLTSKFSNNEISQ